MNELLNLPEQIVPEQNEINHYNAIKKMQTIYNALGLSLAELKKEIVQEITKRQLVFKSKYGTDLSHYTFDENKNIFIRNLGNEKKMLNERLIYDHLHPEIKKASKEQFFIVYKELVVLYNKIIGMGGKI